VKLEGGVEILPVVTALINAGIPVMGHIGMQPQSINLTGGYEQRELQINLTSIYWRAQTPLILQVVFQLF
jgi:ketopantoate hydroxymethyltransferase